jgi:hypothetical protein
VGPTAPLRDPETEAAVERVSAQMNAINNACLAIQGEPLIRVYRNPMEAARQACWDEYRAIVGHLRRRGGKHDG